MADTLDDPIASVLEPFEGSAKGFSESAVADALRRIGDTVGEGAARVAWRAESSAMTFRRPHEGKSVWGTAFAPAFVLEKEGGGSSIYVPDIKDVDQSTLEYWNGRSHASTHPVFTARYADLCWDLSPSAGCKRDVDNARVAIDAYIEASRLSFDSPSDPIGHLSRALDLALMIRDKDRTDRAAQEMFALYDRVAEPARAGTFPFLFDNLYERNGVTLKDHETDLIIARLEAVLAETTPLGTNYNPSSAEAAAFRLAKHFARTNQRNEVVRVWRTYGMAVEAASAQTGPMLALGWLQPLLKLYQDHGMIEDAKRVATTLSANATAVDGGFTKHTVPFEIPTADMQRYVEALTAGDLGDALGRIAVRFVSNSSQARASMAESAKKYPLQSLFAVQKVRDGHVVATIGSVEDDPDGHLVHRLSQEIQVQAVFLDAAFERLRERYSPNATAIAAWALRCGFFLGKEELVERGVALHLAGDFVSSVHVLLPQIESALRTMAEGIGIPPKRLDPRTGTVEDRNLSDILNHQDFHSAIGDDISLYLRTLLNDKRGHNIRNMVSHGLVPARYFSRLLSLQVLHVVLLIGSLRASDQEPAS